MRFLSFLAALARTLIQRGESPLVLFAVREKVRETNDRSKLQALVSHLQKGEPLAVTLPFDVRMTVGHDIAARKFWQIAANGSEQAGVCSTAIELLGATRCEDIREYLIDLVWRPRPEVQVEALKALRAYSRELYLQSGVFEALLTDKVTGENLARLISLVSLNDQTLLPDPGAHADFWNGVIGRQDSGLRLAAVTALGRFGSDATDYVPQLAGLLVPEAEKGLKLALLSSLGKMIVNQHESVAPIAELIADPDDIIARQAFQLLLDIGQAASPAIPRLTLMLLAGSDWRREAAYTVLKNLGVGGISLPGQIASHGIDAVVLPKPGRKSEPPKVRFNFCWSFAARTA